MQKLDDRMKQYEAVSKNYLVRKTPVILRIDGKGFSNYTKAFKKPVDPLLASAMAETAKFLVKNIQGSRIAYTQSDEISILLRDWDSTATDAWFSYNVQKLVSVAASMATAHFNYFIGMRNASLKPAVFDCRAFNLPFSEVCNYFIWRQQDGIRNSISMHAHHMFGHTKMHGISTEAAISMMLESGFDWMELPLFVQRGICFIKDADDIDENIPVFKDCREYIDTHIHIEQSKEQDDE